MFNNIGRKIKGLATVIAVLGILASFIEGIRLIKMGIDYYDDEMRTMWIIIGIVVIIGGSVLSWISAFMTYGFGELVDCASELAGHSEKRVISIEPPQEYYDTLEDLYQKGQITEEEYNTYRGNGAEI